MGRREDFAKVLNHQTPDRLILDLGGCPQSSMDGDSMYRLLDVLGLPHEPPERLPYGLARRLDERILAELDIDVRSVGSLLRAPSPHTRTISADECVDEWGIQWRYTGLYWEMVRAPLAGATLEELQNYRWPDPELIPQEQLDGYGREARRLFEQTDYIVCAEHPTYGIFELGCWMCGFEDFLMRSITEPEFVHEFFSIILNYQKAVIHRYYSALGPYIHYTSSGDDFATQQNAFISPAMFDDLILPYFRERIQETKQYTDAAYLHHSCGNVAPLLPGLIRAGVEILNPIQPVGEDMNPQSLKEKYGDQIVFHGGLDTQQVLPFGTENTIRSAVESLVQTMAPGGGYIFAAAHNIQEDVPPENVVAMFRAARNTVF